MKKGMLINIRWEIRLPLIQICYLPLIDVGVISPSDIRSARMRRDSEMNYVSKADPNHAPRLVSES